ncbi:hypothetical protein CAL22_15935 [Bordetella genomosp. 12]|uniref:Uncharacterized protein n=2 Tax=Bordetella genomosp. 12 TaxID=463035 RepID=A0A261VEV9_9BORD|nr:hypothetical protein CAL22_15935 [Bordetella genomosp. 12]
MLQRRYEQRKKARWLRLWRDSLFLQDSAAHRAALPLVFCLIYLLAECALSARLIEICAVDVHGHALAGARACGRVLSACAIVLLVWPMLRSSTSRGRALLYGGLLVAALSWAAGSLERVVLDRLIDASSVQARATAVATLQWRRDAAAAAPEAAPFAALWPAGMPVSVSGQAVAAMVGFLMAPEPEPVPADADLEQAYQRFVSSQFTVRSRFQAYRDAAVFRHEAMAAWSEPRHRAGASKDAQHAAFVAQTEASLRQQAGVDSLPPGLSLGEFAAHPLTQASWRTLLAYPQTSPPLSLTPIGRETFALYYYRPLRDARAQPASAVLAAPQRYANGAEREAYGRRAYELMVAPMLGLALSLLGMLTHLCRAGLLTIHYVSGWRLRRAGVELVALVAGVWALSLAARNWPAGLVADPAYAAWAASGGIDIGWLDALVRLEVLGYPLFDLVFHVLF